MPNFSSLARLEVPEKFVWGGGWDLLSHFHVKPNRCVDVRLGVRQNGNPPKQRPAATLMLVPKSITFSH